MLRCGMGINGVLRATECADRWEGEGEGGTGKGLEMPESGLTFDAEGEDRGPVGAELPLD